MNQFLEAVGIALNAIWTNKLRSFLTVLGNIVAVTSIIAVVSLIQGMNAYVTNAIVTDVGADNFTIQRMPVVRSAEDEERVRSNPRISVAGRRSRPQVQRQHQCRRRAGELVGPHRLRRRVARQRAGPGRVARLHLLLDLQRRARTPDQPVGNRSQPSVDRARLADGRATVRSGGSDRQGHHDQGRALPGRRRQREEGLGVRPVPGRIRDRPARRVPEDVRRARSACSSWSSPSRRTS